MTELETDEFETGTTWDDVPTDEDGYPTPEVMLQALKAVLDPEIGINIVDLGLVYELWAEDHTAHVRMTLTTMGCPLTELLHQQCTLVLTRLPNIEDVDVEFVFSPPWSTDMISEEAKEELRAMGFNV
jgi:metal-sulfur cluster biosynthetic enzyme